MNVEMSEITNPIRMGVHDGFFAGSVIDRRTRTRSFSNYTL